MKAYFEKGLTVIDTETMGGHISKYGYHGISYSPASKYYTAYIVFKNKRYHIGSSRNLDEAIMMRKEAEKHRDNNTFLEWYHARRKQLKRSKK